ncbi:MAG: hypothetical protein RIB60_11575 [Phycisphaerales bacterium]
MHQRVRRVLAGGVGVLLSTGAAAAPDPSAWPSAGADDSAAVGAAALSGWYAVADSLEDVVELRDIRGDLMRTITKAEIEALCPWMDLDAGPDGPCAVAVSDSGRLVFVSVFDQNAAGDGQPSDAVLKYDTSRDLLTVFARAELSSSTGWPHLASVHHKGTLYVGTETGGVLTYRALRNDGQGTLFSAVPLPDGGPVRGLAVDRVNGLLYAASDANLYRAAPTFVPSFTLAGAYAGGGVRAIAFTDAFGASTTAGVYTLSDSGSGASIGFTPSITAQGLPPFIVTPYDAPGGEAHDLTATACGRLLLGADEDAVVYRDTTDTRLDFESWVADEFAQVVTYAKGLIAPDGEPDGWVIDADVAAGASRFHPATPDAACWAVLLLLADDHVNGTPGNQERVRTILRRYAGLMPDGFKPGVSADGQIRHWCDPFSTVGNAKPGWPTEWASLSTMKIVLAAARAMRYYPGDALIQEAGAEIISRVGDANGWDPYFQPGTDAIYFVSAGAGPDTNSAGAGFHEGIIFANQAAEYGASSDDEYARWLDRSSWPSGTFLTGQPITSSCNGCFQAAFVSLYSQLVQPDFRASPEWQQHIENLLASHGGWTDDAGARYLTVFSAGTTKPEWGGYNADSLSNHPGDVSTFPSLMAFCANGDTAPAVGAYQAYRAGARQDWATGASFLYRRSNVDPAYDPNTAGLPDVGLGALGLSELLAPGTVEAVLSVAYPTLDACFADCDASGSLNVDDIDCFVGSFLAGELASADCDDSGSLNIDDVDCFVASFIAGCP